MSNRYNQASLPPSIEQTVELQGTRQAALEMGRNRLMVTGFVFVLLFTILGVRVVDLTVVREGAEPEIARTKPSQGLVTGRNDIMDRNGVLLATSLPTASLTINSRDFLASGENPLKAAEKLKTILPDLDLAKTVAKLKSNRAYGYLKRNVTPEQQYRVNNLGIPGLNYQRQERRVYPHGHLVSHILGMTDVDGNGIAGLEKRFDSQLRSQGEPLKLSLDVRLQAILHEELTRAAREFKAIGAAGVIMDVNTGEIISQVSLPDYDPNNLKTIKGDAAFNRATKGVYEMGSTFKLFTTAMALDNGTVSLRSGYDATKPIRIARFRITDYHPENRWLSVPEILVYSSNIGTAKMAMDVGAKNQQEYLRKFGLLDPSSVELPEVGSPLVPDRWRDISTMTISYGHGVAVSPLQLATGVGAISNGGIMRPATLLKKNKGVFVSGERIISSKTSRQMRQLMRLVVRNGTGRNADARGYLVGGKTGTAEKPGGGSYRTTALISSFVGVFPTSKPRYVVLAILDEPKGNKKTYGYATAGWVAAPIVSRVIERLAPLVGISPIQEELVPQPGDPLFIKVKARG
ncbi:MAG: penicillin-binding protein 2 [Alphaproteobacteria bacterium]|nr:penicillin-binding protein 2 [Rhodospirillales bacterium]MCW9046420.1 penicillin-binding protein 2 [Alphaproteobacteria bacterium]